MHKFAQSFGLLLLAYKERRYVVRIQRTKLNLKIFYLFYKEGLVKGVSLSENLNELIVFLKYIEEKPLIKGIRFISKPSKRLFFSKNNLIKLFYNNGFFVITTSNSNINFLHSYLQKSNINEFHGGEVLFQLIL